MLTVREAPRETWAGMLPLEAALDGLFVLDIEVPRAEDVRKFLAAKKRLAFCQMSGGDDKVDVSAMKREVDDVSAEIFVEGARVYSARLHVVTRGAADAAINAFSRAGMELVAETAFAGTLLLQCLPLAYDPANDRALRRGRRMLGLNLAHLLPLYGALRGTPSPDLLLLNRRGEPVTFSFFDSPVAPHGIIAGVSGSGKSVLANAVILSAARRGARVFVLDRGNSYRKLCDTLGGTYVAFDPRSPRSINPCGTLLDEEKKIFLADIVSEMGSQGQRELSVKERSLVARAVVRAFDRAAGREVLVGDIRRALAEDVEREARDLAVCLEVFCGDGPYAGFFDRPAEPEGDGCLTVYELGEIAKRRDVASVLLMALIHRITDYARDHLARQKYLIVDEAWTLLRSATTAGFLEDVLRTHRKLQSAAVMVTQQISDFEGRTGEAIRANAPNRLFLQQTPETVLAMEKLLDLSPEEKALLGEDPHGQGAFQRNADPVDGDARPRAPLSGPSVVLGQHQRPEGQPAAGGARPRKGKPQGGPVRGGGRGVIDTVYEYAGYSLAELIRGVFSSVGLPLLLGLAGTAWLVHEMASERASVRQLAVHLFALLLAWGLLSPTRKGEIAAPRLAAWAGEAADVLQKRAIQAIHARFLESPFAWERLAALASFATVSEPVLRKDVGDFLEGCAKPALARAAPSGDNLLADGVLPYDAACERLRAGLRARISRHVDSDPAHRAAVETAAARDPAEALRVPGALRGGGRPGGPSTTRTARRAKRRSSRRAGPLFVLDAGPIHRPASLVGERRDLPAPGALRALGPGANVAISGAAELQQAWDGRFGAKQKYFLATTYGPHVYGLSLLFLLGLFPVAGLWALLPGKWTALLNWLKVFVSVKLWPVCWAALTTFNAKRSAMEAFDPGPRGSGEVWLVVASMYALTPAICFLVVQMGATAAAMPFSQAVPPASGPGLGPAGPVVGVALRAAK